MGQSWTQNKTQIELRGISVLDLEQQKPHNTTCKVFRYQSSGKHVILRALTLFFQLHFESLVGLGVFLFSATQESEAVCTWGDEVRPFDCCYVGNYNKYVLLKWVSFAAGYLIYVPCSPLKSTSLKLAPRVSRGESLSPAICTLCLINWISNKSTPRICRPICHARQGFSFA